MSNFSAISWREQAIFWWDDDDMHFVLDEHTYLQETSLWVDMLIHWDRLFWFWSNQFLLLLLTCCLCSRETANINFIFTIYCIRDEHANHYTTDAVAIQFYIKHNDFKIQRKETPGLSISCSTRCPPKMVFGTSSF